MQLLQWSLLEMPSTETQRGFMADHTAWWLSSNYINNGWNVLTASEWWGWWSPSPQNLSGLNEQTLFSHSFTPCLCDGFLSHPSHARVDGWWCAVGHTFCPPWAVQAYGAARCTRAAFEVGEGGVVSHTWALRRCVRQRPSQLCSARARPWRSGSGRRCPRSGSLRTVRMLIDKWLSGTRATTSQDLE